MIDLQNFPHTFQELEHCPPEGYRLAQRVLDAEVLIDRTPIGITANLVGIRFLKGEKKVLLPPSPNHCWVEDGDTLRPLPVDAIEAFKTILGDNDSRQLSFQASIQLLNSLDNILPISATDAVLSSGTNAASLLPSEITIPGLNATLFPYQAKGVAWMCQTLQSSDGLILADEMGLGKTMQIISLLLLSPPQPSSPALIICPTSLIANWWREIEKFSPSLSVLVHRGPNRCGIFRGLQTTNVVITTYDTMVNDIALFSAFEWSWVICDEAQALKNPDSNRRIAISEIPRRRTIPVTGTPVENTLLDLWSLVDFAVPGLLGRREVFQQNYPDTLESAAALSSVTDPIILKRTVSEVASDLPERIEVDTPLEMDPPLANHYREVLSETLEKYPVAGALVATLQLQLVCAHPWLREPKSQGLDVEYSEIEPMSALPLMTPKMERTLEILHEAFSNKKKVIIFSLFNRVGDLIKEAGKGLPEAYWGSINGSTNQLIRLDIIDEFSEYDGPGCLVLNPKAAGAGLNITSATIVIHFTPVWNPALEAQASARAHRRGQTCPVTIYKLYYEDTVERVMLDRSEWKNELGNEIIPMASRDQEDLDRALKIKPGKT